MKISVVGNAASLFDKFNGHIIDSADMVVRFNGGVIDHPKPPTWRILRRRFGIKQISVRWFTGIQTIQT